MSCVVCNYLIRLRSHLTLTMTWAHPFSPTSAGCLCLHYLHKPSLSKGFGALPRSGPSGPCSPWAWQISWGHSCSHLLLTCSWWVLARSQYTECRPRVKKGFPDVHVPPSLWSINMHNCSCHAAQSWSDRGWTPAWSSPQLPSVGVDVIT